MHACELHVEDKRIDRAKLSLALNTSLYLDKKTEILSSDGTVTRKDLQRLPIAN